MLFRTMKVVTEKSELTTALTAEPTSETITEAATVPIKDPKEMNTQTTVVSTEATADISINLLDISEASTKITSNLPASTVNVIIERSDIFTAIPLWDTSVASTEAETGPITLFHDKAVPTTVISSETSTEVSTENPLITVNVVKENTETATVVIPETNREIIRDLLDMTVNDFEEKS